MGTFGESEKLMKYNIMLTGPIGTGKTFSTHTFLEANKELFILSTEPGIEIILAEWEKNGIDMSHVHYTKVMPASIDWDTLRMNAERTNMMDMTALQKSPALNKSDYKQFIDVYVALANFIDQHGESFGPVDSWDDSRVLVLDGLSGLSKMSMHLVVGAKPVKTQPEWGCAMGNLQNLIDKLSGDTDCTFVLISHIERQINELTGGSHLTISTLGNKLAPELVKLFDEIVYTRREGSKFSWSTTEMGMDLKSRCLPWSDDITPDFSQMFNG
jgi:hypothetical protein